MAENELPLTPDDLTPEWLSWALAEVTGRSRIVGFEKKPIGIGAGFMGQLARLTLEYAELNESAPKNIIAKFASASSATRELARDQSYYQREISFYRDIGSEAGIPVAECFFSAYAEDTNHFVLLLEDLHPAIASDQVEGTNETDSEWVVETIAKLHARWWNSERLAGYAWAKPIFNEVPMEQGLEMIHKAIEDAETKGTFDAYPEIKRLMKMLPPLFSMKPPAPYPYTLIHGDLRSDNVFCPSGEGGRYALIDWQLSGVGQPATDLVRWFAQSITIEQRRKTERALLERYHQRLLEYGVTGYSFKQLLQDYQLNLVVILLMFSNSMDELDKGEERSKAVLDVMYTRLDAALVDWKTVNLLRVLPYMIPFLKLSAWFRSAVGRKITK
jgi:thiamine kinase-like enzyme